MKTRKKLLIALLSVSCMTAGAFALGACGSSNSGNGGKTEDTRDPEIVAVYNLYVASAQASGADVLTYEQWILSVKGDTGATGATGSTGKSAYEEYVANLPIGATPLTEEEWLASLKGEAGRGIEKTEVVVEDGKTYLVITYTDGTSSGKILIPEHEHDYGDSVTLIAPTEQTEGIGYKTCVTDGCGHVELVVLPKLQTYTVTVTGAGAGVTVKLGDYSATTDANGVATVSASKLDYTVVVENTVTVDGSSKTYAFKAGAVTAEEPTATVALPTYLSTDTVPNSYFKQTAAITEDGLYFFDTMKMTDTFIRVINNADTTKKYTITILDAGSVYAKDNDSDNLVSDPFDLYITKDRAGEDVLTQESIVSETASSGIAVIRVTSVDYADGTVYTPIPVAVGAEITLTSETLYYTPVLTGNMQVEITVDGSGSVVWLGRDANGDGEAASGIYLLDANYTYYFTASGSGKVTVARSYVDGEISARAIELTKGVQQQAELGVLGAYVDSARWFKFTGEATESGYLTLASESEVSYIVYKNGVKIAEEDISVLPVLSEEGATYTVYVYYKGEFDADGKAWFDLILRTYQESDALQQDVGYQKDIPYELKIDTPDETYSNRASETVTYLYGSATNSVRYLKYTATADGVLVFNGPQWANCTMYTDEDFSVDAVYTKTGTATGDVCTIEMSEGDVVYILITSVTQKEMTACATFTQAVPVAYTVVVTDSLGNAVSDVTVQLWNGEDKAGEATTDENGAAVFTVDAAAYTVKVVSDDYAYEKEVTTENSMVACTTEVTVVGYVSYTVRFTAQDGSELGDLSGLTATLSGTEASGVIGDDGSVTFTQKVKLGAYSVEVEGYLVLGKTSATATSVTLTAVPLSSVNIITGTKVADARLGQNGDSENAEFKEGLNQLNPISATSTTVCFGWFQAETDGEYTITVLDENLYLYMLILNGSTNPILLSTTANNLEANGATYETKEVSGKQQVYTITISLKAGDILAICCGTKNTVAMVQIDAK